MPEFGKHFSVYFRVLEDLGVQAIHSRRPVSAAHLVASSVPLTGFILSLLDLPRSYRTLAWLPWQQRSSPWRRMREDGEHLIFKISRCGFFGGNMWVKP